MCVCVWGAGGGSRFLTGVAFCDQVRVCFANLGITFVACKACFIVSWGTELAPLFCPCACWGAAVAEAMARVIARALAGVEAGACRLPTRLAESGSMSGLVLSSTSETSSSISGSTSIPSSSGANMKSRASLSENH